MKSFNSTTLVFLILSSLLFMNFQCNDCEDEINGKKYFSVALNNLENTISVGDTLILSLKLDSNIQLESGDFFDNSNQFIQYRIELFKGINSEIDVASALEQFEILDLDGSASSSSSLRSEIRISNLCDDNLCELEFGLIPNLRGYYGLQLKTGNFGNENECEHLLLLPTAFETNGSNNFEIFSEINLTSIRTNSFFRNPESEDFFYFFKVVN